MKVLYVMLFTAFALTPSLGQDAGATAGSFWRDPVHDPMMPFYAVVSLVFIVTLLLLIVALYMLRLLRIFVKQVEAERAARAGVTLPKQKSWLQRLWLRLNASVPVERERSIDLGHDYDGIRELDNHLPPWWKWLFYGTIAWAAIYLLVYHVWNALPLSAEEYENELARTEEQVQAFKASQPASAIDENTLVYNADPAIIEAGKTAYVNNNCASCHRSDGGGTVIGPNLTDAYWIHGGDVQDVFMTIRDGVVEKGMPAWGKVMTLTHVRDLAFYVMSLQGTNPPDPKAPQGELFVPSETQPRADSVRAKAAM